jgi:hypothetical protein
MSELTKNDVLAIAATWFGAACIVALAESGLVQLVCVVCAYYVTKGTIRGRDWWW